MRIFKKIFVLLLVVSIMNLYFPQVTFGQASDTRGQAGVTKNPPEFLTSPELNIPVEKETKTAGWVWVALGIVLVGGLAAAAAGGGGGGGGTTTGTTPTTGSVAVGW
jgi:hypothetical protein